MWDAALSMTINAVSLMTDVSPMSEIVNVERVNLKVSLCVILVMMHPQRAELKQNLK
jgi:hypothetical protein